MRMNQVQRPAPRDAQTHEGAPVYQSSAINELKRAVFSCMLWEDNFYESGESIATRIHNLVPRVHPNEVRDIAICARTTMNLRHVPLLLACTMFRFGQSRTGYEILKSCIQRPDELTETLAIWRAIGEKKLPNQMRKGLKEAFENFTAFQLAKYTQKNRDFTLRDVMFLTHPNPPTPELRETYELLANKKLTAPDTWEKNASVNGNTREMWERLIEEDKLGGLAILRNLRNMKMTGVPDMIIRKAIMQGNYQRTLPFRFIAAQKYAPDFSDVLEQKMFESIDGKLTGKTVVLVDVSGSMDDPLSAKSDMARLDAACGLAMIAREMCDMVKVYTFSYQLVAVPNYRGFALKEAIVNSQQHGGTYLGQAMRELNRLEADADRIIVITDEQASGPAPVAQAVMPKAYIINVASYENGVGYGKWVTVNGWSDSVVKYIGLVENLI